MTKEKRRDSQSEENKGSPLATTTIGF